MTPATFPDTPSRFHIPPSTRVDVGVTPGESLWIQCPADHRRAILAYPPPAGPNESHAFIRPFKKVRQTGKLPIGEVQYGLLMVSPDSALRVAYSAVIVPARKSLGVPKHLPAKLMVFPGVGLLPFASTQDRTRMDLLDHLSLEEDSKHRVKVHFSPPRDTHWDKARTFDAHPVHFDGMDTYHIGTLLVRNPDVLDIAGLHYARAGRQRVRPLEKEIQKSLSGAHPIHVLPDDRPPGPNHLQMNFLVSTEKLSDRDYPLLSVADEFHIEGVQRSRPPFVTRHDARQMGPLWLIVTTSIHPGRLRPRCLWFMRA